MPGLYLHIPFCKQACHYCDFHFSTSLGLKEKFVAALGKEMALRRAYLPAAPLETIYFGGGTPSLLTGKELSCIFAAIQENFELAAHAEITLEANPDDLTAEKLAVLAASPVNRLSIGLQSFHEPHLRLMNRAHTAQESDLAVQRAQAAGFENISVDVIYGVPAASHAIWQADLEHLLRLNVPHVSAYALTVEPDTAFGRRLKKGTFVPPPEEFVAEQFELLLRALRAGGYEQYEISNFCRPGRESRHNSNYWRGCPTWGWAPAPILSMAAAASTPWPTTRSTWPPCWSAAKCRPPWKRFRPSTKLMSTCLPRCAPAVVPTWGTCATSWE